MRRYGVPMQEVQEAQEVLRARNMSCAMPGEHGVTAVFQGLSISLGRGEIVDLVGPSGSGKSSLLTALARLNPHAAGELTFEGRPAAEFAPQQWRRRVAYLPQKPTLIGDSVGEAIRLPWTLAVRKEAESSVKARFGKRGSHAGPDAGALLPDGRIRGLLDAVGCSDVDLSRPVHDLSGGQAARVSLARTLLTRPTVLLADEVDAGLDDDNARLVADVLAEAAGHGMTVVRIRHRPPDGRASRILRLADGVLSDVTGLAGASDMGGGVADGVADGVTGGAVGAGVARDAMTGEVL
ncbi:ABC transporter ATP-binding protein [Bifidobacterium lemurum]|uniref:ABC transporter ATP-binding protein n=2 Tax=Bifidobacterium lemurum TaxID=1603886 RepID=A0A261FW22_9BIFI|nr:ABC transporter ATP-binding protein [Bifidobacterium lemurum]